MSERTLARSSRRLFIIFKFNDKYVFIYFETYISSFYYTRALKKMSSPIQNYCVSCFSPHCVTGNFKTNGRNCVWVGYYGSSIIYERVTSLNQVISRTLQTFHLDYSDIKLGHVSGGYLKLELIFNYSRKSLLCLPLKVFANDNLNQYLF